MPVTARVIVSSTIALLVVGFLALLGIVAMTFWLGERAQLYFNEAIESRGTRSAAVDLRHALEAAESSQRGYLLSGNEIYLAPYGTAKESAYRELSAVKQLLAPHSESSAMLDRLAKIVTDKFAEMDKTIDLKRARRDVEALAILRTNRGKALMDEANVFFSGMIRAADNRLTTGVSEQRENAKLTRLATIAGAVLIVFVVAVVTITVIRYTRELAKARDQVGLLNADLERRVKDRTLDLEQANQEIQRFAYIVTHDLRAPLVNIMGFTSELERGVKSLRALTDRLSLDRGTPDLVSKEAIAAATQDIPEAIGFIRSSTKKMDDLINAILKLAREGRRQLHPTPLDLKGLINESTAAVQHALAHAGGEIRLDLETPSLVTDKLSLEQILGNLLDNAVKYRANNRPLRIDVRARRTAGDQIIIEISDNGRGIAEHDRERVFEPFRRAGLRDQPGEGIGLAHVRALVRNLGGNIGLDSGLDRGTTFRIVLPTHLQVSGRSTA